MPWSALGLAMVFVLLTFGGWNDAAYISADLKGQRAIVHALLWSVLAITVLLAFDDGFRAMVEYTAPVFWLFFLLSGLSLFRLRWLYPQRRRPFSVPLYPWLPALFCLSCAGMLWASLSYVRSQQLGGFNAAWIGVAVLGAGVLLLLLAQRVERASR